MRGWVFPNPQFAGLDFAAEEAAEFRQAQAFDRPAVDRQNFIGAGLESHHGRAAALEHLLDEEPAVVRGHLGPDADVGPLGLLTVSAVHLGRQEPAARAEAVEVAEEELGDDGPVGQAEHRAVLLHRHGQPVGRLEGQHGIGGAHLQVEDVEALGNRSRRSVSSASGNRRRNSGLSRAARRLSTPAATSRPYVMGST